MPLTVRCRPSDPRRSALHATYCKRQVKLHPRNQVTWHSSQSPRRYFYGNPQVSESSGRRFCRYLHLYSGNPRRLRNLQSSNNALRDGFRTGLIAHCARHAVSSCTARQGTLQLSETNADRVPRTIAGHLPSTAPPKCIPNMPNLEGPKLGS
jgi:hypothetical protein